jgi:hypothetical protein
MEYPLVFSFHDLVAGNGFTASVAVVGRVLMSEEDGCVWLYGVQPGPIAGGGTTREAAFADFKRGYLSVLFDIAAESTSIEGFRSSVTAFFDEIADCNVPRWRDAVLRVRKSNESVTGLTRANADTTPTISVELAKGAADNVIDDQPVKVAA